MKRLFTKQGKDGITTSDNKLNKYVNILDAEVGTPLHGAALQGNDNIVKFLIDHGADNNAKGDNMEQQLRQQHCINMTGVIKHLSTHVGDMLGCSLL
ncbi:hypothetical protein FB446DRAFT_827425 [Lentinula raphanica]|nr:hypothetical protein FB446DRAFT_827425 [Lentinula raphanica]